MQVDATIALTGPITLDPRHVRRESWYLNHGIFVSPDRTLTLTTPLEYFGGTLEGRFAGVSELRKTSSIPGRLQSIGDSFASVVVDGGMLTIAGGIDGDAEIHLGESESASLQIEGDDDVHASIFLNNHLHSTAFKGRMAGDLFLGEQGSKIGDSKISGRIHGGDLIIHPGARVELYSSGHTYSGVTRIEARSLELLDDAALTATSEISVESTSMTAKLVLDNRSRASNTRIGDTIPLAIGSGEMILYGNQEVAVREQVGRMAFDGWSEVIVDATASGNSETVLAIDSLDRAAGGAVHFDPVGTNARIELNSVPALDDQLIGGWALIGSEFATVSPEGEVVPYSALYFYEPDINGATPQSNVFLQENNPVVMGQSTRINALRLTGTLDLDGQMLVVESGGLTLPGGNIPIVRNGSLTAGGDTAELIVTAPDGQRIRLEADVIDNGSEPIGLTVGGTAVELRGDNSYSGPTRVNRSSLLEIWSPTALPNGTDLLLNNGRVTLQYAAADTVDVGTFSLRGAAAIYGVPDAPPIRADEYLLEDGQIELEIVGNGPMVKRGTGGVSFTQSSPNYSGQIVIEEGTLGSGVDLAFGQAPAVEDHAIVIHEGGTLEALGLLRDRLVILEGGTFVVGSASIPVEVRSPSRVLAEDRGGTLAGTIVGPGDLTLEGPLGSNRLEVTADLNALTGNLSLTGGPVFLFGDNSAYTGSIEITAREVSTGGVNPFGEAIVRVLDQGILSVSNDLDANILLEEGDLRFSSGDRVLSGQLSIEQSTRFFVNQSLRAEIAADTVLADEAQIHALPLVILSGTEQGDLVFSDRLTLLGNARIAAYDGNVEITGTLVAGGADAVLDLVNLEAPGGFLLDPSLEIPAGTSLRVTENVGTALADLVVDGSDRFVAGGGTLSNPLTVRGNAKIQPGSSLGQLAVNGNVILEDATLEVELAGTVAGVSHDSLLIDGQLENRGAKIEATFSNGFMAAVGDRFSLVEASGGISQGGWELVAPVLDPLLAWDVEVTGHSVLLTVLYEADFDADGDVDGADFLRWQLGFGTATGATRLDGDADRDGDVDGGDFLKWQLLFGRETSLFSRVVPEPGSIVFSLMLCLLAVGVRTRHAKSAAAGRRSPPADDCNARRRRVTFATAGTVLLTAATSNAQSIIWVGPPDETADWLDPNNWTTPFPTQFYEFRIDNGGTALLANGTVQGQLGYLGYFGQGNILQTGGILDLNAEEGTLAVGVQLSGSGADIRYRTGNCGPNMSVSEIGGRVLS